MHATCTYQQHYRMTTYYWQFTQLHKLVVLLQASLFWVVELANKPTLGIVNLATCDI